MKASVNTAHCKNCENRELGCHSLCEQYILYSLQQEKMRQQRFKLNQQRYCLPNASKNKR